ncbi:MAG: hypothetical protein JRI68_00265 [Deltaproteobacteria bacterium]|nr:hypothetical protein [Deltaproteobacteria bacterium]
MVLTASLAAVMVAALGQAGCGDDDEGSSSSSSGSSTSTTGTGGGGGSTSTSSTGTGGSSSSSTGTGGSTSTSSGTGGNLCEYTGPGECAPGQAWELDLTDPCMCCVVYNCEAEGTACCNEPGCMAIAMCVFDAGCSGMECLGPCGQVIQENGGITGAPVQAAQAVGDCVEVPCATCDGG